MVVSVPSKALPRATIIVWLMVTRAWLAALVCQPARKAGVVKKPTRGVRAKLSRKSCISWVSSALWPVMGPADMLENSLLTTWVCWNAVAKRARNFASYSGVAIQPRTRVRIAAGSS